MDVETVQNIRKMETLVVNLMWTDKIKRIVGEMFMIARLILISKIDFIQPMKISTSF